MSLGRRGRLQDDDWEISDVVQKLRVLSIHPRDYDDDALTSSFKRLSVTKGLEPDRVSEAKKKHKSYILTSKMDSKLPGVFTTSNTYEDMYKLSWHSK